MTETLSGKRNTPVYARWWFWVAVVIVSPVIVLAAKLMTPHKSCSCGG